MKRLTCEMCGSTDLIKQDGVFVCQTCGCKYSIEEARKMMVEGTVEVTGTVKVDNSDKINNLLLNAKRAFEDKKYSQAQELCSSVLAEDPNNVEAILYEGLSIGWQGGIENYAMDKVVNAAGRAISLAYQQKEPAEFELFIVIATKEIFLLDSAYITLIEKAIKNEDNSYSLGMDMHNRRIRNAGIYGDPDALWREYSELTIKYVDAHIKYRKMKNREVGLVLSVYKTVVDLISEVDNYLLETYDMFLGCLTFLRKNIEPGLEDTEEVNNYADKIEGSLYEYKSRKEERIELAKQPAIDLYWEAHKSEKDALLQEKASLWQTREELKAIIESTNDQIAKVNEEKEKKLPDEEKRDSLKEEVSQLTEKKNKLGLFKLKEKKECDARINEIQEQLTQLDIEIDDQRVQLEKSVEIKINDLTKQMLPTQNKLSKIKKRIAEINEELTRER